MRAMFLVVGSILLCAGLFGCDSRPQATAAAPVVAAVPPAPCNCTAPAPPPAPVAQSARVEHHYRHHRHTVAEFEQAYPGYGESGGSYSESSSETREYLPGSSDTMTQADVAQVRKVAWVDGYGRAHYASGDTSQDENPARLNGDDHHLRHDPYRGWNSHCDERDVIN
jgi:hypothetical protein